MTTRPVSDTVIDRVVSSLGTRNIEAIVVDDAEAAKAAIFERLPEGAEVHSGKSKTLEDAGIFEELQTNDRYDFLRTRYLKMDRATQGREIRKLIAAPDFMLGSPQAITEDGVMLFASATGSQLGPLAYGAGRVLLVAGAQKIVPTLEAAFRRILEVVFPWENARVRETLGVDTSLAKTLVVEREWVAGRFTVVLVREALGI